jgi:hypothetical protein
MKALHIVTENPSKNSEYPVISESKLETAYVKLSEYLEQAKETKGQIGFEAHEAAVTRLVYTLGQAALSHVLMHYDTKTGMSWWRNGGQDILIFRSPIKSQLFDRAWAIIATQYKKSVIEHQNVINLIVQN